MALVVDDDPLCRVLLGELLRSLGFAGIAGFGSMEEVAPVLVHQSLDLAVIDLSLGTEDGVDIIAAIRAHPNAGVRGAPVVAISASSTVPRIMRAMEAGADSFLVKPFSTASVLRAVRIARVKRSPGERSSLGVRAVPVEEKPDGAFLEID